MSISEIAYQNIMYNAYAKEPGILLPYLDYLYEVQGLAKGTAYNYYMTVRTLAKFLKHERHHMECEPDEVVLNSVSQEEMASISQSEWESYLDYYELKVKETRGSFAVRISIIRGFYRWLNQEHDEPMPDFVETTIRPLIQRKDFINLTEKQEETLCRHLRGENMMRNACIVRMFIRCGLGLQEICDLRLEDVELTQMTVSDSEGRKRVVPMDEVTRKAVDDYLAVRQPPMDGKNSFFVSSKKKRMRRGAVEKMLRKAVALGGNSLAGVTIRDLQLTAKARLVSANGVEAAGPITNVDSVHYFRRVFGGHTLQNQPTATPETNS